MTRRADDTGSRRGKSSNGPARSSDIYLQSLTNLEKIISLLWSPMVTSQDLLLHGNLPVRAQPELTALLLSFAKLCGIREELTATTSSKSTGPIISKKSPKAGHAGSPKKRRRAS